MMEDLAQVTKGKIDQLDIIKIKSFWFKGHHQKYEKTIHSMGQILVNFASFLMFLGHLGYINCYNSIIERQPIFKVGRDLNRNFSKEVI